MGVFAVVALSGCGEATTIEGTGGADDVPSFRVTDTGQPYDAGPRVDSRQSTDARAPADTASPEDARDSGVTVDAAAPEEIVDSGGSADTPDTKPPVQPQPVQPCATAACWDTSLQPQPCHQAGIDEDYSTGKYNVHRYASVAHAGAETSIQLTRTGGAWQPALLAVRKDGSVLSDGVTGATGPGLEVTVVDSGQSGDLAEFVIQTDQTLALDIFVTGWSVVDAAFGGSLPSDSKYHLLNSSGCAGQPSFDCSGPIVNGNPVAEPACGWLHHIGLVVVGQLAGSLDERLDVAAPVAWWALKEGVLFLQNPIVYSNCNSDSGDSKIGPLDTCGEGHAWQVGLSGVQVPTFTLAKLEQTAATLFPGTSTDVILEQTAQQALLAPDQVAAVVASTGPLRRSWLLRNSPIGFTVQVGKVVQECVQGNKGWCHGTKWNATTLYAPDKASAMKAIADIRALLQQLAQ